MSNPHDGFQADAEAGWFRPTPQETFAGGDPPYKPGEFTRTCEWKWDAYKYGWMPSCRPQGVKQNDFTYCPYCGKEIEVVK